MRKCILRSSCNAKFTFQKRHRHRPLDWIPAAVFCNFAPAFGTQQTQISASVRYHAPLSNHFEAPQSHIVAAPSGVHPGNPLFVFRPFRPYKLVNRTALNCTKS